MTTSGKKAGAPNTWFCLPVKSTEHLFPTQELLKIPTIQTQDLFFTPVVIGMVEIFLFSLSLDSQGLFSFWPSGLSGCCKKKDELVAFSFLHFKIALQEVCQMAGDLDQ